MASGPAASPTSSFWLETLPPELVPPAATSPPADDMVHETVIIGAGMTGAATAYWLKALYGRTSVVLDARGCAGGATGRNGGHLWPNPKSDFERDTVARLLDFLDAEGVACDLRQRGALALERRAVETDVVYHDAPDDPEADDETEWGEQGCWDEAACDEALGRQSDGSFAHGAHFPEAGSFHPAKVVAALLRRSGARLCAPVRVLGLADGVDADGTPHVVLSVSAGGAEGAPVGGRPAAGAPPSSATLRARRVVVATNAWAAELLPELASHLYPARNQVLVTRPLPPAAAEWRVGSLSVDSDVGARELCAEIILWRPFSAGLDLRRRALSS